MMLRCVRLTLIIVTWGYDYAGTLFVPSSVGDLQQQPSSEIWGMAEPRIIVCVPGFNARGVCGDGFCRSNVWRHALQISGVQTPSVLSEMIDGLQWREVQEGSQFKWRRRFESILQLCG